MAQPGDEFTNPDGGKLLFRQTSSTTQGELLEVEAVYPPGSELPPAHFHPAQEERFEIKSGILRTIIEGQERYYGTGESFVIPQGVPHQMHNGGDEPCRFLWQTRPILKTEQFFETVWGLAQDGKMGGGGSLLQMMVIGQEYREVFRLVNPPQFIQRILFGIMAPIGKLRGYRGYYPEYSGDGG